MSGDGSGQPIIRIAAALIEDDRGRLLLVRKAGTSAFMQAGGKIEPGETPLATLRRELGEELGLAIEPATLVHLGCFTAPAANEPGHLVEAELYHLRSNESGAMAAEIEEAVWVDRTDAVRLELAPLTRDHVLTIAVPGKPD